ncbi:hypothetical protein HMI01_17510 [Halolactibacillus miurensis]|uniref:DUF5412 domain-containing protein n=1 Tax=Halolactibacillus miurensis TaxID=306541 RepID=A0A1I6NXR0_9BACI|nr:MULTISPECIES: DUF5412 family protein [Halolactibacillus]GEM04763.1 hypothetical protein HMI01_17510 [Halolactibacillus miurensis]SFS32704.1 hypothetical protein SAMN05421668_10158 [Halolactibacillus miurensis]
MKRSKMIIIGVLVVGVIAVGVYFSLFHVNLDQYDFHQTLTFEVSPDGQYQVELILLGKQEERYDEEGNVITNKNESYDQYARLWYEPETTEDGSTIWHDKHTKIIYYEKNCTEDNIEWLDDDTIIINDMRLNIHRDVYDYRRK